MYFSMFINKTVWQALWLLSLDQHESLLGISLAQVIQLVTAQNNFSEPQIHAIVVIQSCKNAQFFSASVILMLPFPPSISLTNTMYPLPALATLGQASTLLQQSKKLKSGAFFTPSCIQSAKSMLNRFTKNVEKQIQPIKKILHDKLLRGQKIPHSAIVRLKDQRVD